MPSTAFIGTRGRRVPLLAATAAAPNGQSSRAALQTAMVAAATFIVASGVFVAVRPAYAGIGDIFALGLAWIFNIFTGWVGQLLLIVVGALIWVAQYNGFVNSAPVANGWSIVRDVTNMFFILVLLVIAFGTILGVDAYSYKNKMLSRLLIMAVVVNFSRTICGLLIDFAQVVMLTFVYGFKEAAGGNFADALRITQMMQPRTIGDDEPAITAWSIAVASILSFFLVLISLVVVILMTITLAIRIVYLWLLVVLSPLAFFLKAVPGGSASGYYGMWWKMFTSQVIVGPVMAFFLWLSLVSVASNNLTSTGFPTPSTGPGGETIDSSGPITQAFQGTEIESFIIAICLLMGGLQLSKQISAESAGAAPGLAKKAASLGMRGAKALGRGADSISGGRLTKAKESALSAATGIPLVRGMAADALSKSRAGRAGKSSDAAKMMSNLNETEKMRLARGPEYTPDQKALKKEALRSLVKDAKPETDEDKKKFFAQRDKLKELGTKTNDTSVKKDMDELERKRPGLIINPDEKNADERRRQMDSYRKTVRGMNGNKIAEMNAGDMNDQFMMLANPKALLEAQKFASSDQLEKLTRMGGDEASIRASQDQMRLKGENFGYLSEKDRIDSLGRMSDGEIGKIGSEFITGGVLSALADQNKAGLVAQKVSVDLDYDKLRGDQNLARQIASGLEASAIGRMPKDVADVLRGAIGAQNPEKVLASGGSMGQAFQGYDAASGSFGSEDARKAFTKYADRQGVNGIAGNMNPDELLRNGGFNDVSMQIVSKMDADGLRKMAGEGKGNQVFGVIQAAESISGGNGSDALGAYQSRLKESGVGQGEIDKLSGRFIEAMDQARNNAQKLLEDLKKGGDIGVGGSMTFSGKAGAAVKTGAVAAGSAVAGAVKSAPGAVARAGSEAYQATKEAAKQAGRAASDAFKEAQDRANTVKRKLGRLGKRL